MGPQWSVNGPPSGPVSVDDSVTQFVLARAQSVLAVQACTGPNKTYYGPDTGSGPSTVE